MDSGLSRNQTSNRQKEGKQASQSCMTKSSTLPRTHLLLQKASLKDCCLFKDRSANAWFNNYKQRVYNLLNFRPSLVIFPQYSKSTYPSGKNMKDGRIKNKHVLPEDTRCIFKLRCLEAFTIKQLTMGQNPKAFLFSLTSCQLQLQIKQDADLSFLDKSSKASKVQIISINICNYIPNSTIVLLSVTFS